MSRPIPSLSSSWILLVGLSALSCAAAYAVRRQQQQRMDCGEQRQADNNEQEEDIAMLFGGNSMLYFNDCPRLLQQMVEMVTGTSIVQNSCLRGGASLPSLWEKGNGMSRKFATEQAAILATAASDSSDEQSSSLVTPPDTYPRYDIGAATVQELLDSNDIQNKRLFVVLNDYTQAPARPELRTKTEIALQERYAPLLRQAQKRSTNVSVIVIQTPGYRVMGLKDSDDLGDFESMSDLLAEGVHEYVFTLQKAGLKDCRVAPVGEAFRYLYRNDKDMWNKLYSWDSFHPSPYGTWLQACVLYITCFGRAPPQYDALWWERSRYMQPPDQKPLPLPTEDEARDLNRVACLVCGCDATLDAAAYVVEPLPPQ